MAHRLITRFYAPVSSISGNLITLPPSEAKHALGVLRMRVGDTIEIVDGCGRWYKCLLEAANKNQAVARIEASKAQVGEPAYRLTMGIPLLKQGSRMEFLIEKGTELGVTHFTPVLTERTERTGIKIDRLRRVAIAAMKQSGRSRLPTFGSVATYSDMISEWSTQSEAIRVICHESCEEEQSLGTRLGAHAGFAHICILVGPEGGFTEAEVTDAERCGFLKASLGPRRLRSETACIVAASIVSVDTAPYVDSQSQNHE